MKMKDLEALIEARANDNVQKRITAFKTEIDRAVCKLFCQDYCSRFGGYRKRMREACDKDRLELAIAMTRCLEFSVDDKDEKGKQAGWPSLLWRQEAEALRTELLSKMDLMQQLITSNRSASEDDVQPEK